MSSAINAKSSFRFLLPAVLVICGAGLLIVGFDRQHLQAGLDQLGVWAPIVFVVAGIALMSICLPKTIVSLTAGALFGTYLGGGLMLLVAVGAAASNYSIGRWWLSESIRERLKKSAEAAGGAPYAGTSSPGWAHAIHDVAAEAGWGFHFLIRLVPVPSMIISYSMGAAGAKIVPFMTAAAMGVIPQLLWVHGGSIARLGDGAAPAPYGWVGPLVSVAAALAVSVVVPRAAMQRIRMRQAANIQ